MPQFVSESSLRRAERNVRCNFISKFDKSFQTVCVDRIKSLIKGRDRLLNCLSVFSGPLATSIDKKIYHELIFQSAPKNCEYRIVIARRTNEKSGCANES